MREDSRDILLDLLRAVADDDPQRIAAVASVISGPEAVQLHNTLVDVDNVLRECWQKDGSPDADLLRIQ